MNQAHDQEHLMTLEDVGNIPQSFLPMMCLCNGFTSVFGLLISVVTKGFWNHFQWLISPTEFASQWFWFRRFPVSHYKKYSLKLWYNPDWTEVEKRVLLQAVEIDLCKPKWQTRYDVLGVIGYALGIRGMQNPYLSFCSEYINKLCLIDPDILEWSKTNPSPTPEELNNYFKASPRFKVYARVMPG